VFEEREANHRDAAPAKTGGGFSPTMEKKQPKIEWRAGECFIDGENAKSIGTAVIEFCNRGIATVPECLDFSAMDEFDARIIVPPVVRRRSRASRRLAPLTR
jgi:hypothetical protein